MKPIRITAIGPTTVSVPLEAPLRHANGCHWGRFVRTVVEVDTDAGISGLGEMGGGGESAEAAIKALESYLVGTSPFDLERQRFMRANPSASLYNNRTQMLAAIEFACIDIMGKALDIPAYQLFGGKSRDSVPFASYLFFRYPDQAGRHEVSAQRRATARQRAGLEGTTWFQEPQAEGRRVRTGLRACLLSRARRSAAVDAASHGHVGDHHLRAVTGAVVAQSSLQIGRSGEGLRATARLAVAQSVKGRGRPFPGTRLRKR